MAKRHFLPVLSLLFGVAGQHFSLGVHDVGQFLNHILAISYVIAHWCLAVGKLLGDEKGVFFVEALYSLYKVKQPIVVKSRSLHSCDC